MKYFNSDKKHLCSFCMFDNWMTNRPTVKAEMPFLLLHAINTNLSMSWKILKQILILNTTS